MEVKKVFFSYGKNEILKGASLEIEKGKVTTIMGANGCGKSTLFSLMTKNLVPGKGKVLLGGKNIAHLRLNEFARKWPLSISIIQRLTILRWSGWFLSEERRILV